MDKTCTSILEEAYISHFKRKFQDEERQGGHTHLTFLFLFSQSQIFIGTLCISFKISNQNQTHVPLSAHPLPELMHSTKHVFHLFSVSLKILDAEVYWFEQKFTLSVSSLTQTFCVIVIPSNMHHSKNMHICMSHISQVLDLQLMNFFLYQGERCHV